MAQLEPMLTASVELRAVLSAARVASGALAALVAGAALEVVPAEGANPIVILEAAGYPFARARVRLLDGRLVATIIDFGGDREARKLDDWRITEQDPART